MSKEMKFFFTGDQSSADLLVGQRLKDLRTKNGFSLRALADSSGLNINTLSLIENGKSSPSVDRKSVV